MNSDTYAYLKKESPFYNIFPNGRAPIINLLIPSKGRFVGSEETEFYKLDVERCTEEQLNKIAELVVTLRGGNKKEVMDFMKKEKMLPVRKSQTDMIEAGRSALSLIL